MIYKAGSVLFDVAVNHFRFARPEQILSAVASLLLGGNGPPDVLNDAHAFRYVLGGEKTTATVRAFYDELVRRHGGVAYQKEEAALVQREDRQRLSPQRASV